MTVVYYAIEGDTDAPVAEKLLRLVPVALPWLEVSPNLGKKS